MKMDKYICAGLMFIGFLSMNPSKISAQCHIKDVIMGVVPEDKNLDDERYYWSQIPKENEQTAKINKQEEYAPHSLIIYYDTKKGKKALLKAVEKKGCKVLYDYKIINGIAIKTPDSLSLEDAIPYFKKIKGVMNVEKDRIMHID